MENASSTSVNFQKPKEGLYDWFSPSTFGKIEQKPYISPAERKRSLESVFNHIDFEVYTPADLKVLDLIEYKPAETGLGRVKDMFRINEFGFRGCEFEIVRSSTIFSGLGLFCFGGAMKQEDEIRKWKATHATKMFKSPDEARRRLQSFSIRMFLKNAVSLAAKGSIVTALWTGSSLTLSAYQDQFALWHTSVFGGLIAFVAKLPKGIHVAFYSSLLFGMLGPFIAASSLLPMQWWYGQDSLNHTMQYIRQKYYLETILDQQKYEELKRICKEKDYWPTYFGLKKAEKEWDKRREYELLNDTENDED